VRKDRHAKASSDWATESDETPEGLESLSWRRRESNPRFIPALAGWRKYHCKCGRRIGSIPGATTYQNDTRRDRSRKTAQIADATPAD